MHGSSDATPAPSGQGPFVPLPRPAESSTNAIRGYVLYQGEHATVTTGYFESGGYRYPVVELSEVGRAEHGGVLQPRSFELWARFRGQQVRLFHSDDAREFGQVCRALTRAREHAGIA